MHNFSSEARAAFTGLVCAVLVISALGSSSSAATPSDDRSVPGSVVPSTGTTSGSMAPSRDAAAPRASSEPTAGSLSPPPADSNRCANLRKAYARSQACFAHYRLKNGGLQPGAFKHCREMKNPSLQCGSAVVG